MYHFALFADAPNVHLLMNSDLKCFGREANFYNAWPFFVFVCDEILHENVTVL